MKILITMRMVMQSYLLSPLSLNQTIMTMRLLPLHIGWLQPTLLHLASEGAPVGKTLENRISTIVPEKEPLETHKAPLQEITLHQREILHIRIWVQRELLTTAPCPCFLKTLPTMNFLTQHNHGGMLVITSKDLQRFVASQS
jgi:hypothetical protein